MADTLGSYGSVAYYSNISRLMKVNASRVMAITQIFNSSGLSLCCTLATWRWWQSCRCHQLYSRYFARSSYSVTSHSTVPDPGSGTGRDIRDYPGSGMRRDGKHVLTKS
jgi:hypothetical protein